MLKKFEAGKRFPGPVPGQEGAVMELWKSGLTVIIQTGRSTAILMRASYGTRECPEKTIDLLEWFDSRTNDWYLIDSESDPGIVILVGNGPYAAYRKSDVQKSRFITI